ncbi:DUF3995 domain-containing protein [Haloglycomyces albus]|uniref:DUF3995 domain-containing protein n=1 Tax=Haloglycomyces albus TaxID=526067 RepID=UPI00046CC1C3|nr:DUF3995 domain-containing protein [Haloglycomyces albus]
MTTKTNPTAINPAAWLLIVWSAAFGGLSVIWASGGTWLVDKVSPGLQQMADDPVWWFILLLWGTAVVKFGYGVWALAITRPWGRVFPRWLLLFGGWTVGPLTLAYGSVQFALAYPVYIGKTEYPDAPDPETLWWYVFVWDPIWIVGGALTIAAVVTYQLQSRRKTEPEQ